MTEQTQPTDAEISACILAAKVKCVHPEAVTTIEVARAVLAKWYAPAGAGDVAGWVNAGELLALRQGATYAHVYSSKQTGASQPLFTTPQPTQAQAGAVPRYRLLVRGLDTIRADDEFLREDCVTWSKDPSGIFVGCRYEGTILLPARRSVGKDNGIKGADHG